MHSQAAQWALTIGSDGDGQGGAVTAPPRTAPLRVDAQRNLEHVLRAAREVFGELGYGAPMEDVARRARVGVGLVVQGCALPCGPSGQIHVKRHGGRPPAGTLPARP